MLADFSELDQLTEELLKRDFEQFLFIFTNLQKKLEAIDFESLNESVQVQSIEVVYNQLNLKIELVERFQGDVKVSLINLTNSQKILKKYTAE